MLKRFVYFLICIIFTDWALGLNNSKRIFYNLSTGQLY